MLNGAIRSVRALALGLAFMAVGLYAVVMPWHLAKRFSSEVAAARHATMIGTPCSVAFWQAKEFDHDFQRRHGSQRHHVWHQGAGQDHSAQHGAGERKQEPNPRFRCPLCKGLAALQFVLLASVQLGLPEPYNEFVRAAPLDNALTELFAPVPQSRGPPFAA